MNSYIGEEQLTECGSKKMFAEQTCLQFLGLMTRTFGNLEQLSFECDG